MIQGETKSMSDIVAYFAEGFPGERITLGDFVTVLGDRSFGILLLIFALPSALPLSAVPGVSTVFGIPMAAVAAQMMIGMKRPAMPGWLLSRSVARADLQRAVARVLPYLRRLERVLRPRWLPLTSALAERAIGGACLLLALIVTLPIPFGNQPPSLAIALFAVGIFERDGLFVIAGLIAGVVSLFLLFGVYFTALQALLLLLRQL